MWFIADDMHKLKMTHQNTGISFLGLSAMPSSITNNNKENENNANADIKCHKS